MFSTREKPHTHTHTDHVVVICVGVLLLPLLSIMYITYQCVYKRKFMCCAVVTQTQMHICVFVIVYLRMYHSKCAAIRISKFVEWLRRSVEVSDGWLLARWSMRNGEQWVLIIVESNQIKWWATHRIGVWGLGVNNTDGVDLMC